MLSPGLRTPAGDAQPAAHVGVGQAMQELYLPAFNSIYNRKAADLEAIRTSTCWRITAPLRAVKQWIMQEVRHPTAARPE